MIPIRPDAKWYRDLRQSMKGIPIRWQNDNNFHITLAFMDTKYCNMNLLSECLGSYLHERGTQKLHFDCLDVFTTQSGKEHIIYLTCSQVSKDFSKWVGYMRAMFCELDARMTSDFKLHVTLGRISAKEANLNDLQRRVKQIQIPPFTLPLQEFYFKEFGGQGMYGHWHIIYKTGRLPFQ